MVYLSRIYTRSGDGGETGLGDGTRVPKDSPRIQAIGDVDELNAALGVLLADNAEFPEAGLILAVQNDLFDIGGDLCMPIADPESPGSALRVTMTQVERVEQAIDRLNTSLEPLRSFILPGGSPAAARLHLARTVCRRAERSVWTLSRTDRVNQQAVIYLNRLSDLLFVLARTANAQGAADVLWVPGRGTSA